MLGSIGELSRYCLIGLWIMNDIGRTLRYGARRSRSPNPRPPSSIGIALVGLGYVRRRRPKQALEVRWDPGLLTTGTSAAVHPIEQNYAATGRC
jgi:hypothetical protein